MQSKGFQDGLRRLEAEARKRATAIMCAEAFVARCHRSLISDALTVAGWRVRHIQSRRTAPLHRRTPFLKVRRGRLLYPEPAQVDAGGHERDLRPRLALATLVSVRHAIRSGASGEREYRDRKRSARSVRRKHVTGNPSL
jgi:hypothetical protein